MSPNPSSPHIKIFPDLATLSHAAADLFLSLSSKSIKHKPKFSVALSGGSTPRTLHQLLASPDYREKIPWSKVHLFWGDERCVPPDHPDSNYRMAQETLISHITVPPENIHPMPGDMDPDQGAKLYEDQLREFFAGETVPRFDLILLGIGTDGHTASLFPGADSLKEKNRFVVADRQNHIKHTRLTLALPVINNAETILFVVSGKEKAAILAQILGEKVEADSLPAKMVQPERGELYWYMDEAASRLLR